MLTFHSPYDALDRVTKIQYNNGSGGSILYDFDNNGNQTSVVDNTGTTTFLYDADNRILKKTLPGGQVLSSTYDGVGNLLSSSDAGGTVSYTYTKVNLIETITEPHDTKATTFTYANNNQRQTQTYPNGVVTTWQYDKANRITSDVAQTGSGTVLFNESDSYLTISGNTPTELLQTRTNTLEQHQTRYRYDTMNRLTDAPVFDSGNVEVDDYEYRFDGAGNWLSSLIHLNATQTKYQYNADNELTSKTQGTTTVNYTYDGAGNLLSFTGGPTSAYNAKNQTKSIGSDTYTYSGASRTERVQVNGTNFVYSGLGLSSQKDSSGTTYYTRCSCGLLIDERLPDGSKHYYITNSLGSIVGLTDQAGTQLVNTYDYDPTGNILSETKGVDNVWKYAGGYFNEINGTVLYKFGTRYDDPETSRWTQQDPVAGSVGKADSLNWYLYAGDDPVNEVGPKQKAAY